MIKKSYCFIILVFLLSIPLSTGIIIEENNDFSPLDLDKTLLLGTIFNPSVNGTKVNAYAISLVYYNHNDMDDNIGVVQGFKKVSFEKQPLFFLWKPGPFGLISYVFGYCTDFEKS